MQVLEFNTVVIGSGLAGLAAANHSSKYGNVALITKSQLNTSNSYYAQGGIAVALSTDDLPDLHLQDTLVAGRGLCDYDAVKVLVNEGKDCVNELIGDGMQFDKIDGKLVMGLEGGHNKRRILHADGDATGKELTCFLLNIVKQNQEITTFENYAVIKLLQNKNCLAGVQIIDVKSGNNVIFKTQSVILATGGLSRIYTRTTNPHIASGDGIALAYNVGARIADLEFVQFHPSALYVPGKNAYLISEAVRGEGAWLLNSKGERFMKDLHPLAELAPRDIVAYSIFKQIQKSKEKYVYLSLKHLNKEKIIKRFKHIYLQLKEYGIDLASDLVPIAPAAHYMVGGVLSNLNAETNITGLFVCGEVASTGVMGANRLASNSLLECLVFGKRASEQANRLQKKTFELPGTQSFSYNKKFEQQYISVQNEIALLMSGNMGVVRNKKSMEFTLQKLSEIANQFSSNINDFYLLKIQNLITVCKLMAKSALIREESRGGHIREDFQKENPDFKIHIIQEKNKDIGFEPVRV